MLNTNCDTVQTVSTISTKETVRNVSKNERTKYNTSHRRWARWVMAGKVTGIERFRTYMSHLYQSIPAKRVSELYTLCFVNAITKRYLTYSEEVQYVLRKLRRNSKGKAYIFSVENWDVSSGERGIVETIEKKESPYKKLLTLDIDPTVMPDITANFSNPSEYKRYGRPVVIWSSFQFNLCDIHIPQAYYYARKIVITQVACDYLTNRPHYRTRFLREVSKKGEVRVISDIPIPKGRRGVKRCQWLILAKTRQSFKEYFDWPRRPYELSGRLTFSESDCDVESYGE